MRAGVGEAAADLPVLGEGAVQFQVDTLAAHQAGSAIAGEHRAIGLGGGGGVIVRALFSQSLPGLVERGRFR